MSNEWFGRGCPDLSAQWENHEISSDSEPVLKFCNHKDNPEDTEGNCRYSICPILVGIFGKATVNLEGEDIPEDEKEKE